MSIIAQSESITAAAPVEHPAAQRARSKQQVRSVRSKSTVWIASKLQCSSRLSVGAVLQIDDLRTNAPGALTGKPESNDKKHVNEIEKSYLLSKRLKKQYDDIADRILVVLFREGKVITLESQVQIS